MSIKLTDTQLLMLSAAAQREDRCVAAPPKSEGRRSPEDRGEVGRRWTC